MPRGIRRSAEARASRVHAVQLNGTGVGGDRGTIRGPLPLWLVHQGITYVRTPEDRREADGRVIHHYRAVDGAAG